MASSIVEYIHELRQAVVSDQVSEIHARQLAQVIEDSNERIEESLRKKIDVEALATKKDVELAIEKLRTEMQKIRYEIFKFIVWTGTSVVFLLGGMLAKGFHWF